MGFRFRKSIKLGPVNVNLSKSGVGYSVGGKGLRVTKKADGGTRTTVSIPGTGISHVTETSAKKAGKPSSGKKPKKNHTILGGVIAVLVLICAVSACSGSEESSQDEGQPQDTVEETVQEDQQDAQQDAQEPAESQETSQDTQEDQDPAQETQEAQGEAQDTQAEQQDEPEAQQSAQQPQQPQASDPDPAQPAASQTPAETPAADPAPSPEPEPEPTPEPEPAPAENQANARTVYITPTGSKYHYDNSCNGGTYIPSTLAEAQSMGLTPCKKCAGG